MLLAVSLALFNVADAQVGRLLKDRAKKALQDQRVRDKLKSAVSSELDNVRAEYDSTSFNYAIALSDNAGLFESKEQFERQKKFLIEYVQRKDGEITAEERARGWVDRSEVLYATGKYKLAIGLLLGAKTVYEELQMTESIEYARTISNLSLVAHSLGRLNVAQNFGENSLDLRARLLGTESRGYAASLNNYALLKKDLGEYNEAEKLLNDAVNLNKTVVGENSMGYAITLNNQAVLNQVLGRYDEAEPLFKKALDISESFLKEKSGNYQRLQTNLALLYQDMGRLEEAERLYLDAISLKEKRFGKAHPDYAHMLNTLASLYVEMGKDEEVERLLKESITIYTAKMGENSKNTASAKSDLGNFYRYKGRNEEALALLQNVAAIRKNVLGPSHPQTVQSAEDLALVNWKLGNMDRAKTIYQQVMGSTLQEIDNYFIPMSEAEKAKYWKKMRPRFQRFYAFALDAASDDPEILKGVFNLQLATKALLLNTGNKIKNEILNSGDETLKQKYNDWIDQKESLSHFYTYSQAELQEENINIDSLERAANDSERYLSENSTAFKEGLNLTTVKFADVVSQLGPDEALVEIIHTYQFTTHLTDNSQYVAMTATSDSSFPKMVILENGDQLEGRYYKFYNNAIHNKLEDNYSYDQFWKPIEAIVGNKKKLYLSLDGIYNQINLNTLKKPSGNYLVSDHTMTLLSSSKDILRHKTASRKITEKDIILLGYPEYGGDGSITLLPGTKKEVENISSLLKTKRYKTTTILGAEATEGRIKGVEGIHVLHIATHGYFLQDLNTSEGKVFGINTEKAKENPLLRSGLMFTGAGETSLGVNNPVIGGSDNGILTAYESMNLKLDKTNLVVLSACETGLGDVIAGEGVYGLQRSLLIAGADNLIMSLWKVDDTATQKLMTLFYRYLGDTGDIATSFRQAQTQLKKEYPHPYYWGAFVLISG